MRVKMHVNNNSPFSICLLIMLDTLLLVPSLHCNTLLHFTTLHQTTRSLVMDIVLPETCWACNKIFNKYHLLHLVSILFPHNNQNYSLYTKHPCWCNSHHVYQYLPLHSALCCDHLLLGKQFQPWICDSLHLWHPLCVKVNGRR